MKPIWLRVDAAPPVEAVLDALDVDRRDEARFADVANVAVAAWRARGAVWLALLDGDAAIADEVVGTLGRAGFSAERADAPPIGPDERVRVAEWRGVDRAAIDEAAAKTALLVGFVGLLALGAGLAALVLVVRWVAA